MVTEMTSKSFPPLLLHLLFPSKKFKSNSFYIFTYKFHACWNQKKREWKRMKNEKKTKIESTMNAVRRNNNEDKN